jgi:pimeloyl-ACP methyl ester carboxylesterase
VGEVIVARVPYVDDGGPRLWYDAAGEGPAVVCLHEGVTDSRAWAPFAAALAPSFRVLRFDRRGYGRSERWTERYAAADDVLRLLDATRIERASLVGGSAGGATALAAALEHPERVERIVVAASHAPGMPVEIEESPELEARWEDAVARGDLDAMAEVDLAVWAPLGADGELRTIFRENAAVSYAEDVEEPVAYPEPAVAERLAEIRAPVLVVTGGHDHAGFEAAAEALVAGLPHARRARIAEADHLAAWRQPDELARLVLDFLARPDRTRPAGT